jgi:hypothetical protein
MGRCAEGLAECPLFSVEDFSQQVIGNVCVHSFVIYGISYGLDHFIKRALVLAPLSLPAALKAVTDNIHVLAMLNFDQPRG